MNDRTGVSLVQCVGCREFVPADQRNEKKMGRCCANRSLLPKPLGTVRCADCGGHHTVNVNAGGLLFRTDRCG